MGLLLLGFVAFDMCVLYMLNYSDPQVKSFAYKLVSQCIAIFCALLTQVATTKIFVRGLELYPLQMIYAEPIKQTQGMQEFGLLVSFVFWFAMVSVSMFKTRNSEEDSHAAKGLIMHVAAFAALDLFAFYQTNYSRFFFADASGKSAGANPLTLVFYMLSPVLGLLFFALFGVMTNKIRKSLMRKDHEEDEHAHSEHAVVAHHDPHWVHVAKECEIEAAAIAISFLFRQLVLLACTNALPDKSGNIKDPAAARAMEIMVVALFSAQICISYSAAVVEDLSPSHGHGHGHGHGDGHADGHGDHHDEHEDGHEGHGHGHSKVAEIMEFLQALAGFALSWCLLSLFLYYIKSHVKFPANTKLLMAAAISPFTALFTIVLDKCADWGIMREKFAVKLVECIGLMTGLAWEKAFLSSIDAVSKDDIIGLDDLQDAWVGMAPARFAGVTRQIKVGEALLFFFLLLLVLPAWKWYIVPSAAAPVPPRNAGDEKETKEHEGKAIEASSAESSSKGARFRAMTDKFLAKA